LRVVGYRPWLMNTCFRQKMRNLVLEGLIRDKEDIQYIILIGSGTGWAMVHPIFELGGHGAFGPPRRLLTRVTTPCL